MNTFASFATAILAGSLAVTRLSAAAVSTGSSPVRVVPRDIISSTVEWSEQLTNSVTGQVTERNHSYVKIGSGLNYSDDSGQLQESQDLIELTDDGGAAAVRGPHKIRFKPNLNAPGAIGFTTSGNHVFRSQPRGLYYVNQETAEYALVVTPRS